MSQTLAHVDQTSAASPLLSLRPLIDADGLRRRLAERCRPRVLSPTLAAILQLTDAPDSTAQQIAAVVRQDAGMAVRVLAIANSAAYATAAPVTSVHKAVMTIGLKALRSLALTIAIVDQIRALRGPDGAEHLRLWEHATATALAAAAIAKCQGRTNDQIDEAFTLGLLHDIGQSLIAVALDIGAVYGHVRRFAARHDAPISAVEKRLFEMSHGQVAAEYLQQWPIGPALAQRVADHERQTNDDEQITRLCLAERLTRAMLIGVDPHDRIKPIDQLAQQAGLNDNDIQRIESVLPRQTRDLVQAMTEQLSDKRNARTTRPCKVKWIEAPPRCDAYRMALDQLSDPFAGATLACIHIRTARSLRRLQRWLAHRANQRELIRLLIVSDVSADNIGWDHPHLPGRVLLTPTTVAQLHEAIDDALAS